MEETFCCFCSKSTAKFFGWLGIIGSVILSILSLYVIYSESNLEYITQTDVKLLLILSIIFGVASNCLVSGTTEILIWLIISFLFMLLEIHDIYGTRKFKGIAGIAFGIYLWIAMFSLYKKIKRENGTDRVYA